LLKAIEGAFFNNVEDVSFFAFFNDCVSLIELLEIHGIYYNIEVFLAQISKHEYIFQPVPDVLFNVLGLIYDVGDKVSF